MTRLLNGRHYVEVWGSSGPAERQRKGSGNRSLLLGSSQGVSRFWLAPRSSEEVHFFKTTG